MRTRNRFLRHWASRSRQRRQTLVASPATTTATTSASYRENSARLLKQDQPDVYAYRLLNFSLVNLVKPTAEIRLKEGDDLFKESSIKRPPPAVPKANGVAKALQENSSPGARATRYSHFWDPFLQLPPSWARLRVEAMPVCESQ
jgi:hypothetical protein